MSKWVAETTGLESKEQLKAHREHYAVSHLVAAGLSLPLAAFWTAAEKVVEAQIWREADLDYESRKAALKAQLVLLGAPELALYFTEIGVAQQDINVWLAASPVL